MSPLSHVTFLMSKESCDDVGSFRHRTSALMFDVVHGYCVSENQEWVEVLFDYFYAVFISDCYPFEVNFGDHCFVWCDDVVRVVDDVAVYFC